MDFERDWFHNCSSAYRFLIHRFCKCTRSHWGQCWSLTQFILLWCKSTDIPSMKLCYTFCMFQGNIQRKKVISDQLEEAKCQVLKLVDHKCQVIEMLNCYSSRRSGKKRERVWSIISTDEKKQIFPVCKFQSLCDWSTVLFFKTVNIFYCKFSYTHFLHCIIIM